jgi:hypothetical protein
VSIIAKRLWEWIEAAPDRVRQHVPRSEVVAMLERRAAAHGMTLDELVAQGRAGTLDPPELRDLWLIWGDLV